MERIYKYPLEVTDKQVFRLPKHSTILTVQVQNVDTASGREGRPMLWATVNSEEKSTEQATVRMFGTGHPIEDGFDGIYISTIQLMDGQLVFHVFLEL